MIALNISICTVCKFFAKSFTICVLAAKDSKMMIETIFFLLLIMLIKLNMIKLAVFYI